MCGADAVQVVALEREVVADDGTQLPYRDELMACSACGQRYYTHDQSLASSRARAGALRQHAGLLTPDHIRAFREGQGLSQAQLEEILGTGAKTVVRWEKGTVCQSRAADQLLRLLMANPWNLKVLAGEVAVNMAHAGGEPAFVTNFVVPPQFGLEFSWIANVVLPHGSEGRVFLDTTIVSPSSTASAPVTGGAPGNRLALGRAA